MIAFSLLENKVTIYYAYRKCTLKIRSMKNKILFIMVAMLVFSSCRKDDIVDTNTNPPPVAEVFYEADIIGKVVDQDGNAIEDVLIKVSDNNGVTTDINGLFRWEDLKMDSNKGTFLEAIAEGYFESGFRVYAGGTYDRTIEITLVKKEISGYVNGASGDVIALDGGLEINFPANAFTANGGDYVGLVTVHAYHLDPSEEDYLDRSPGDLSGTDETGVNYILESFGMVAVEMETADGQYVQLREGVTATLIVPVDNSLLGDAPATIPLWHFDDIQQKWVKEGQAELINGKYVGQVSHFSWWNCDDFEIAATLCIQIFDGRYPGSLEGLIVELTSETQGTSTGVTDSEGNVLGQVPGNEVLQITVYNQCGEVIYSGSIGPYTGNDNKEIIPVTIDNVELYDFSGTVFDCEAMETLNDAIVKILIEGREYYTETDEIGMYSASLLVCDEGVEYVVFAYSAETGKAGSAIGATTADAVNVLDVNLCNDTPFIIINFDMGGLIISTVNLIALEKPNETIIAIDIETGGNAIGFSGNTTGTFPASFDGSLLSATNENCTVTITQYESGVGGYIKGSIQGIDKFSGSAFSGSFGVQIIE